MAAPNLDAAFINQTEAISQEILTVQRNKGRVSALMSKGVLQMGVGFEYTQLFRRRSGFTGGTRRAITAPDGSGNICIPAPGTIRGAMNRATWEAFERSFQSEEICFEALYRAVNPAEQLKGILKNFQDAVGEIWEVDDKQAFFGLAGHKIVANATMTESTGATMPAVIPTSRAVQGLLDIIYQRAIHDGAGETSYATSNGGSILTLICSMNASKAIINENPNARQDFQYAEMGMGSKATLLKGWGSDKAYSNFQHVIDNRMPRHNLRAGAWVPVPYWVEVATETGPELKVNPDYLNADTEDMYVWNEQVCTREMPKPMGTYGSLTSGEPTKWNGEVIWINERNMDPNSVAYNPRKNRGVYFANLQAGYRPGVGTQYGYVVRVSLCNGWTANPCHSA